MAGLTVAAISVPQAMAYALIAGIEPRFGLYSAIVVTAVASVLGSSTHLINGPTNAISLVVFSALAFVDPSVRGDAFEAVFFLAIMVGVIQVLVAIFKLGDLTRYISESVLLGFMAGAGILILLGQVGNLFGLESQGTGHQHMLYRLWLTIAQGGPINVRASCLGFGTAVLVLVLRWWVRKHHLPRFDMLLALTAAAVIAAALGWTHSSPGGPSTVQVVGDVPLGLPMPHVPRIRLEWTREMAGSALAIAVLGLVEALSVAKSIAQQTGQSLDYNRQCLAEGAANFIGGLFQCLPGSGSLTRSAINFHAGAVSRMSGVFAAGAVAFVVVALAPLRALHSHRVAGGHPRGNCHRSDRRAAAPLGGGRFALRCRFGAHDRVGRGAGRRRVFHPHRRDPFDPHVCPPRRPLKGHGADCRRGTRPPRPSADGRMLLAAGGDRF